MGRRAKTTQEHERDGTFNITRHGSYRSPTPPIGVPVQPGPLAEDGQAEWERMIERMEHCQTLSTVDGAVLYQYCQLFAETEQVARSREETAAAVSILEENLQKIEPSELIEAFREIATLRKLDARYATETRQCRMALVRCLSEFGLTPASRSRVKIPQSQPHGKADPLAALQDKAKRLRVV